MTPQMLLCKSITVNHRGSHQQQKLLLSFLHTHNFLEQLISAGIDFCLTLQQSLNKIFSLSPESNGKEEENFTLYLQGHL